MGAARRTGQGEEWARGRQARAGRGDWTGRRERWPGATAEVLSKAVFSRLRGCVCRREAGLAEGLAHTGGAWRVACGDPRSQPGFSGLRFLPQSHSILEVCPGLVPSPGVGCAGFRSWGSRDFPDPLRPPPRLSVEVRACQHVPVGLHAPALRPQGWTPADGRGLHQQPPRYRRQLHPGWLAHVLPHVPREVAVCTRAGHREPQHMAAFVSPAALRTRAKWRRWEQLRPVCAHSQN